MSKQESFEQQLVDKGKEILSDVDRWLALQYLAPNEPCPSFLRNGTLLSKGRSKEEGQLADENSLTVLASLQNWISARSLESVHSG